MILRRYYINIVVRVILLVLTSLAFTWSWQHLDHLFTFLLLGLLLIFQLVFLINYLNRVNRELSNILHLLSSGDVSDHLHDLSEKGQSRGFRTLLNSILASMEKVKIEREMHYQYLKNVLEFVDVGLIAFTPDGKVSMSNRCLKNMLGISQIRNIRRLNQVHPDFENNLRQINPSRPKLMVIRVRNSTYHLVLHASVFLSGQEEIRLVSVQNIRTELDEKELDSWQKLIRVLTHEIMNSVSPILSVATTVSRIFKHNIHEEASVALSDSQIQDTVRGLELIRNRSEGLLEFIKQYRKINLLPKPEFTSVRLLEMLNATLHLLNEDLKKASVETSLSVVPDKLEISMDRYMMEQVMINLINNSIHAMDGKKQGRICIHAFQDSDFGCTIQVIDNGTGIPEDIREHIFTPFFTTRENGSGIGLSLSKQIIHLHSGTIQFQSVPGTETIFSIHLPA
jgi:nitrogen fixation/metabolism regulation signal transduction histidine kinase